MTLLTNHSSLILWKDVIKLAESRCSINLDQDLETYLVSLLIRYTNKPEVAHEVFATSFLEAMQLQQHQRNASLRIVGDGCLIYAGLFPDAAAKKNVTIGYFVDLGRSSYAAINGAAEELYYLLALRFVALMDVLQSIQDNSHLLPLQAYEQWNEVGSQRALQSLQAYCKGMPFKNFKR
jgi:hypothetical protein